MIHDRAVIDRIERLTLTGQSFRPHRAALLREHLARLRGGPKS